MSQDSSEEVDFLSTVAVLPQFDTSSCKNYSRAHVTFDLGSAKVEALRKLRSTDTKSESSINDLFKKIGILVRQAAVISWELQVFFQQVGRGNGVSQEECLMAAQLSRGFQILQNGVRFTKLDRNSSSAFVDANFRKKNCTKGCNWHKHR